ncbi:MAG TPA: ATP-binding protein, partial [Kineosporiaceae bacterium]|nr:ATP-binding protein [Kineosporiaceae bacterium]
MTGTSAHIRLDPTPVVVGVRRQWGIGGKLALLTGALLAVLVVSSSLLVDQTRSTARAYDSLLAHQVQQGLLARQMQVEFKKQVQEWKDILLRGFNPADLNQYSAAFHAQDDKVNRLEQALLDTAPDPKVRAQVVKFRDAHRQLDADYEQALSTFVAGGGRDPRTADHAVRGLDRPPTDLIDGAVAQLETTITGRVAEQKQATASRQRLTLLVGGALLLLIVAVLALAVLNIVRPIRRITREAQRTASERLPSAIASIKTSDPDTPPPVMPSFNSGTRDELHDLGQALNSLQDSALRQAIDQHKADRETADMLINLGRRNQNLLGRMLSYVTDLERREQDPEVLSELFRLDHAATRIRRNAESMLVLAGATQTRTWSQPVPCIDVVRAALSEIEEYTRVDLHHVEDGALHGTAVADVVHLIAELVENATHFSPPSTQVTVIGQQIREGYRIRVIDQGVGMTRREVDEANRRIQNSDNTWSDAKLLGLYVVGRLARRRAIQVALEPSAGRGITATILLPTSVLASDVERRGQRPGQPPQPGQPRQPVEPNRNRNGGRATVPAAGSGSVIDLTDGDTAGEWHPMAPAGVPSQWSTDAEPPTRQRSSQPQVLHGPTLTGLPSLAPLSPSGPSPAAPSTASSPSPPSPVDPPMTGPNAAVPRRVRG